MRSIELIDDEIISEFAFLYWQYGLENDANLAPDALELKRKVLAALTPPPTSGADDGIA